MKLSVFTRIYDCPYFTDWYDAMRFQSDRDYALFTDIDKAIAYGDFVLFTDIDDIPKTNFVEVAKMATHDVTGYSMKIIDHHGRYIGDFGREDVNLDKYNVYGLTNTVYRSSVLKDILEVSPLLDWQMIRTAERMGASMYFSPLATVQYRRYGQQSSKLVKLGNRYVWRMR